MPTPIMTTFTSEVLIASDFTTIILMKSDAMGRRIYGVLVQFPISCHHHRHEIIVNVLKPHPY